MIRVGFEVHIVRSKRAMTKEQQVLRLHLDSKKAVQAVDYIARKWPGVTQYYVCKIIYFADKSHCLDWGRTISGDHFVAMEHGPVPSRIYEMLKPASGEEDELLDMLNQRLDFSTEGNKIHIHSRETQDLNGLSPSDMEHLDEAIALCKSMGFGKLRDVSHEEAAWKNAAADSSTNNPPMDLADWFDQVDGLDKQRAVQELVDNVRYRIDQP